MALLQTGMTVSFGTSSYAAEYVGANGEAVGAALASAHMGTSGQMPKVLGDLFDGGSVRFRIWFDPNSPPPIDGASETVTITFRTPDGGAAGATLAGPGGVTQSSWTADLEALGTGEFTLTWTAAYTWTDSS